MTAPGGDEAMLEQALAMSMNAEEEIAPPTPSVPDFGAMTEEEQIAYAMQMSMSNTGQFNPNLLKLLSVERVKGY